MSASSGFIATLASLAFAGLCAGPLRADVASPSFLPDPGLEIDGDHDDWPDGWTRPGAGATWAREEGNRFLRLVSSDREKTVSARREIAIPAGTAALELVWRWRTRDLKPLAEGCDARVVIAFIDANGRELAPISAATFTRLANSKTWREKRVAFLVPERARAVAIAPSLIRVESGSADFDDIILRPTEPAPVAAAVRELGEIELARRVPDETARPDRWPAPLRVQGNRLVDPSGAEVWLQGLNAGGLETDPLDTQPVKSLVVGIDDWKARVVRLPVQDRFWFGLDPRQDDGGAAYRERIDKCVMLAANRGAYLVLDLHEFRAPRERHVRFWRDAAARYANHPAVLFDLFNEPFGTSWEVWRDGGFVAENRGPDESAFLSDEEKKKNQGYESVGMQALLDAVRAAGAKNVVVVAGLGWSYDLRGIAEGRGLSDPEGRGIAYSWHVYNWHRDWEKHVLAVAAAHPILVGEVGADVKKMNFIPLADQENPHSWVPDMLGFIQKHRLNWTGWCFHPSHTPVMIEDWKYTPTPFWGAYAKDALAGKSFESARVR